MGSMREVQTMIDNLMASSPTGDAEAPTPGQADKVPHAPCPPQAPLSINGGAIYGGVRQVVVHQYYAPVTIYQHGDGIPAADKVAQEPSKL